MCSSDLLLYSPLLVPCLSQLSSFLLPRSPRPPRTVPLPLPLSAFLRLFGVLTPIQRISILAGRLELPGSREEQPKGPRKSPANRIPQLHPPSGPGPMFLRITGPEPKRPSKGTWPPAASEANEETEVGRPLESYPEIYFQFKFLSF